MKILRHIGKYLRCERGVAATEFAVALPFLMVLMLGGFELSRYVILHQKLEKIAYTVADVVSQSSAITNAQLNQAAIAAGTIMEPNDFSPQGLIIVSSVYQPQGSVPTVRWQYQGGGQLARESSVGLLGATASLPGNMPLNDKDNVIVAEVFYHYTPLLTGGVFTEGFDIYKATLFKPRLGALTTPPS